MKLFALSDLHVGFEANRRALDSLDHHPDDWLVLAGDLGETLEQIDAVFRAVGKKFGRVLFGPGNHELWTTEDGDHAARGTAKYDALIALARSHDVVQ